MSKKELFAVLLLGGLLVFSGFMLLQPGTPLVPDSIETIVEGDDIAGEPTACTADAKMCPNGSYVGRVAPSCEFAECPSESPSFGDARGVLYGTVSLSPMCPVEQNPPDPRCAPAPYQGSVEVRRVSDRALIAGVTSDAAGRFTIALPAGTYFVEAEGGNPFPQCAATTATILPGATTDIALSCDTGIR